jgi:AcrR family transcriptional regulator
MMVRGIGLDPQIILQTAAQLADEQGIDKVTLAALARRLGIRSPSLYNHIDGLPGLRTKLTVYGLRLLKNALTQAVIGRSGDDAIRAMALAYITFAREHPGLYPVTLSAPDTSNSELIQEAEALVQIITQVLQHYGLDEEKALHAVRVFRSLLHGFSSLEQSGGFGLPLQIDKTLHMLIETALAGIHMWRQ